jgi:hypothetical protein
MFTHCRAICRMFLPEQMLARWHISTCREIPSEKGVQRGILARHQVRIKVAVEKRQFRDDCDRDTHLGHRRLQSQMYFPVWQVPHQFWPLRANAATWAHLLLDRVVVNLNEAAGKLDSSPLIL